MSYKSWKKKKLIFSLSISDIRPSDSGMYQCFVSNEIGTVTSSAHLSVTDIPPKFATALMPKKLFAVVGSDLVSITDLLNALIF